MFKRLILASATAAAFSAAAVAQSAPKPIARADYVKLVDSRFNAGDTNHDGFVSKTELVTQQQRELDAARAKINQQLLNQFKQLDTNKDGQISQREFLAGAPPVRGDTPDQIIQRLDTNHDGKISAEEFRAPELAKFNKVDANHDGVVTPDEIRAAAGRK